MRIEVLVGNDDPIIFPLKSQKVTLGSSEHCDVIIEADGVSRKHIFILSEGDNYFVVDQGSTNGSFINEERLIPGKKIEFTSFFPVRLGDNVLVSLLSDEEGDTGIEIPMTFAERSSPSLKVRESSGQNEEAKTSVISLTDLKKVKTEKLVANRNQKRATNKKKQRKEEPKKKKKKFNPVPYFVVTMILGAGVYNYLNREIPKPVQVAQVGTLKLVEKPKVEKSPLLVSEGDLVKKEDYLRIINNIKCTTDVELYLCDTLPGAKEDGFGVAQVGLTYHVMVNGAPFLEQAAQISRKPIDDSPVTLEAYDKLLKDTAVYLYLLKIKPDLDLASLKGMILSIAFFQKGEAGLEVVRVIALKPEAIPDLGKVVQEGNLRYIKTNGSSALLGTKDYYVTY